MKKLPESYTLLGPSIEKGDVPVSASGAAIRESTFDAQDGSSWCTNAGHSRRLGKLKIAPASATGANSRD
jgi:hypothetical protein